MITSGPGSFFYAIVTENVAGEGVGNNYGKNQGFGEIMPKKPEAVAIILSCLVWTVLSDY